MNQYDLDKLPAILQASGIYHFYSSFVDHNGRLGMMLRYYKKMVETL